MIKKTLVYVSALIIIGCSAPGPRPARIDLEPFGRIGIVTFEIENAEGVLDEMATNILYGRLKEDLKKAELVRLGKWGTAGGIGSGSWRELCRENSLDAVFSGKITVSGMKPEMAVKGLMHRSRIRMKFRMTAELKLITGIDGKELWSESVSMPGNATYDHFTGDLNPVFKVSDNDESYVRFVRRLIFLLTEDLR